MEIDEIFLKGSQALKTINIDLKYPGVDINIDFLHIHKHQPQESFNLHAHPNFELHYIADGEGEVGILDTDNIDSDDIVEIPAIVKSISSPALSEYHLKRKREAEIMEKTKTLKIKQGDLFLNPPRQFCWQVSSADNPIIEYGMRFSFSIKETLTPVNKFFIKEHKVIHQLLAQYPAQISHENSEIKNYFETIFREAHYMHPGFVTRIKNELLNIIIAVSRQSWDRKSVKHYIPEVNISEKRLTMIDSFIESNISSSISIGQLAKYLFMSDRNLCRFVMDHKGISVHQYILQIRIKKAINLFTKSDLTLSDVAFFTGFSSPFHLSKAIKKFTGKNPSEL